MPPLDNTRILPFDRQGLLNFLPRDSIGAEIGVEQGIFSELILSFVKPKKLYLIDSWIDVMIGKFQNQRETLRQEKNYNEVRKKFQNQPAVEIVRESSENASKLFKNNSLDWVYIDADHSYEGVSKDLVTWGEKIKIGGFMCGHDWTTKPTKKGGVIFGVNRAVEEYVLKNKFELLGITNENNFKSFVLKKIYEQ